MRAFTFRGSSLVARASLSAISTSRMWCSAEKTENKEAPKEEVAEVVSEEVFNKVQKELEDSKKLIDELRKEVLYRAAEAENARRIGREDVEKAKLYGITSFGKDMLEVADTLEKGIEAFNTVPPEELEQNKQLKSIFTGMKLSSKVLLKNMSKHGIEKMNVTLGTKFDPNIHDALVQTSVTDTSPHEHISHVLKDGYTIKNRVLRAAQVGVASDSA
ncbi:molecular chaperone GrpE [Strigomonas culicis]|uniref:GrpE protein homolog n=1 Tax=Strigomonas culicis TaxID=28005 RepID=S9UM06_9TRYP|nr:molecular chaperone GrpE [Strigomonas culicis]EPY26066.1 molecular chaperone GrpE [Strigomonas culicis]EPY29963.1 molecular chaperone GrpE [Strigomonas culicis]EPY31912.1 molecular chaperone GrpE [Strigomonas culicis]|eukprot:EPY22762.1 molecular chaperone GrpE [Strigomonas culicis]